MSNFKISLKICNQNNLKLSEWESFVGGFQVIGGLNSEKPLRVEKEKFRMESLLKNNFSVFMEFYAWFSCNYSSN
jgi:hypothetical protein